MQLYQNYENRHCRMCNETRAQHVTCDVPLTDRLHLYLSLFITLGIQSFSSADSIGIAAGIAFTLFLSNYLSVLHHKIREPRSQLISDHVNISCSDAMSDYTRTSTTGSYRFSLHLSPNTILFKLQKCSITAITLLRSFQPTLYCSLIVYFQQCVHICIPNIIIYLCNITLCTPSRIQLTNIIKFADSTSLFLRLYYIFFSIIDRKNRLIFFMRQIIYVI